MKTTIELLREGLERFSLEKNWCAGLRWKNDGSNCALGVLERVGVQEMNINNWTNYEMWGHYEADKHPLDSYLVGAIQRLAEAAISLRGGKVEHNGFNTPAAIVAYFNNNQGWERTKQMFALAIENEQKYIDQQAKELIESATQETAEHQAVLSHMR